jgi:hypothetical protein
MADGTEVPLAARTVLALERANELSSMKMRQEAETRTMKGDASAMKLDTHDCKILRCLVNNFSTTHTPPVAEADAPSAGTRLLTTKWTETVRVRVRDPIVRAKEYRILLTPTDRIIKVTAGVRFGRKGLHPDLFKSYSFDRYTPP